MGQQGIAQHGKGCSFNGRNGVAVEVDPQDSFPGILPRKSHPEPDDGARAFRIHHHILFPPADGVGTDKHGAVPVGKPVRVAGCHGSPVITAILLQRKFGIGIAGNGLPVGHLSEEGFQRNLLRCAGGEKYQCQKKD